MNGRILHEFCDFFIAHRDNNLFMQGSLSSYVDMRFGFWSSLDNIVNLVDLLRSNGRKDFFDFDDIRCVGGLFGDLGIRLGFSRSLNFWLLVLKVLGNNIDLLLRLSWDQWGNPLNTSQGKFRIFLGGPL